MGHPASMVDISISNLESKWRIIHTYFIDIQIRPWLVFFWNLHYGKHTFCLLQQMIKCYYLNRMELVI